jgi:hypothetical protein
MQELVVIFLVVMSCYILYKYSLPDFCKYRLHLSLTKLLFFIHADKLARYIDLSRKPRLPERNCTGSCHSCRNGQDQTAHFITFLKKEPDHSATENR